jgi:hypothetical protein
LLGNGPLEIERGLVNIRKNLLLSSMGYRHIPLSQRSGLSFDAEAPYWRLDMPDAECFMYFVAHMHQLFGKGYTLYVEGRDLDPEVLALYRQHAALTPVKVTPVLRNPATIRLHVSLGGLGKAMNHLAACKTFSQMGEVMSVYKDGTLWLDGSRLSERIIRLSGELKEAQVRKFAGGYLRGEVQRVDV